MNKNIDMLNALSMSRVIGKPMNILPSYLSYLVNSFKDGVSSFSLASGKKIEVLSTGVNVNGLFFDFAEGSFQPRLTIKDSLGIIPVNGPIFQKSAGRIDQILGFSSYEEMQQAFDIANNSEAVQAIVFEADSPGGEAAGMVDFIEHMHNTKTKPIYAVVNNAFSAAYGVISVSDKIFVTRSSGVGSVGTVSQHVDYSKMNEMDGITVTEVFAGDEKTLFSYNKPLSDKGKTRLQEIVDSHYIDFVGAVAKGRGISNGDIIQTQARIFKGQEGVDIGFADVLSSVEESYSIIKETLTKKEVKQSMDIKELQEKFPELYESIVKGAKTEIENTFKAEKEELESKIVDLKKENVLKEAEVKGMDNRLKMLEKTQIETLSKSIWEKVLSNSELPEEFKENVQDLSKVSFNAFVKEDTGFDEKSFTDAIKAEVTEWEQKIGKIIVLGSGKTVRKETVDSTKEDDEAWLNDMYQLSNPPSYEKIA